MMNKNKSQEEKKEEYPQSTICLCVYTGVAVGRSYDNFNCGVNLPFFHLL